MAGLHWNHSFYPTRLIFPRGERMEMRERSASIHACFTCARGHRRNSDCIVIYDRQGNPLPHNDHRSLCNVRIKWAGLANCRISQLASIAVVRNDESWVFSLSLTVSQLPLWFLIGHCWIQRCREWYFGFYALFTVLFMRGGCWNPRCQRRAHVEEGKILSGGSIFIAPSKRKEKKLFFLLELV